MHQCGGPYWSVQCICITSISRLAEKWHCKSLVHDQSVHHESTLLILCFASNIIHENPPNFTTSAQHTVGRNVCYLIHRGIWMWVCFTTCLVPSKALADRFHFSAGSFALEGYASCLNTSTKIGNFGGFIRQFNLWPSVQRNTRAYTIESFRKTVR